MAYINNEEIVAFIGKAHGKMAKIATAQIQQGHMDDLALGLDLMRAIKMITSEHCQLPEEEILKVVHHLTRKARLNEVAYLNLPTVKYLTKIGSTCTTGALLDHKHVMADITDWTAVVGPFVLARIQEELAKLWPLNQEEQQWVRNQVRPFVNPSLSFTITHTGPYIGYRERGVNSGPVTLQGGYVLNSGQSVTGARYKVNGTVVQEMTSENATASYIYTQPVITDIFWEYEVDFAVGGTKNKRVYNYFTPPYYIGVEPTGATAATVAAALPKNMVARTNNRVPYLFPLDGEQVPVIMFEEIWGEPTSILVSDQFETFKPENWRRFTGTINLNGSGLMQNYIGYQSLMPHKKEMKYTFIW